ncbi:MAG TPA: hypothetical protein VJJ83_00760 [Candidatus Babeliales bacterium]|nr:hypothetical protein [Candidatus Babeliales bacterium]
MNNFGTTAQYGLKDFSANSTSLITRNQAFGQGQVFRAASGVTDGSFMNFMISYTPTDINIMNNMLVEGDRADLKVFDTAGPLDNLSIYALDNLS